MALVLRKPQMGQYIHINSFTLWKSKTCRIYSLVVISKKNCFKNYFNKEVQVIKQYGAWNCY